MPDRGYADLQAIAQLEEWREQIFVCDHSCSQLDASAILDDRTIRSLTTVGSLTATQVTELLEPSWIWWPRYGHDLTTLITNMHINYRPLPKKPKRSKTTVPGQSEAAQSRPRAKRTASEADRNEAILSMTGTEFQVHADTMPTKRPRTSSPHTLNPEPAAVGTLSFS